MKHYITLVFLIIAPLLNAENKVDITTCTNTAHNKQPANGLRPFRWFAEGNATTSSGRTPFWLANNHLGLSSLSQNNGYLRGGIFREMELGKRFSWGAGADLVVPYGFTSHFVVQQLYGEIRYRSLQLTVGSKKRYVGLINQELSSGDMTFSLNSRPIPQVFLSMPEYQYIPYTKKLLAVRGYFSIGIQTDGDWQKSHAGEYGRWSEKVLYNTKGLFVRWGNKEKYPIFIEGALEMGTQFGGDMYRHQNGELIKISIPRGFKDIIQSILGLAGGNPDDPNQWGERANCLGNHLGQWTIAAIWKDRNNKWKFKAYFQHYFEDHSMMFLDYVWKDMLVGLELRLPKNGIVDKFVYEYLCTKDQSGPVFWDHTPEISEQVSGRDNYYNHSIYSGWQHWGMGIGNPLLISPIYNMDGTMQFYHNRIKGHHFGFSAHVTHELSYKAMLSYTRSWGTYNHPAPKVMNNINALLEIGYSSTLIKNWDFRLSLGLDGGALLGQSIGASITVRKRGWL